MGLLPGKENYMSKQDRQGVRTPGDVERKYNLGRTKDDTEHHSQKIGQLMQSVALCEAKISNLKNKIENIYPIGSVYISTDDIEPSTLFGGSWELMKQGYIVAGTDSENELEYLDKCNIWKRIKEELAEIAILDEAILDFAILS